MRRHEDHDCNACWQSDCDCECQTCAKARDQRQAANETPGQTYRKLVNRLSAERKG